MTQSMRGVVLEGCSAAGKTSVLGALKRLHAARDLERNIVVLGEHYSQVLQRVGGEYIWLTCAEHRRLLDERLAALEALQAWGRRLGPDSRQARSVFFVLERFHLNHRMRFTDDVLWSDALEARLDTLGGVCALLTVSASRVGERLTTRLRASGRPHDVDTVAASTRQFLDQQSSFLQAAEQSNLRTIVVSTDDGDWARCATEILDALE